MRPRSLIAAPLIAAALTALTLAATPAQACRLALALGFDVSRSVDQRDYEIQLEGIIAALDDAEVRGLILSSPDPVAMAVFEWAGPLEQALLVDWSLLTTAAEIDALVATLQAHERQYDSLTAVGHALAFARALFDRAPPCLWQTLDLSGDGQNNIGPEPQHLYGVTDFADITVNGLAIGGHEGRVLSWYRRNVLRGPGAFAEFAPTHRDFAETFRRKLIRELTEPMLGALSAPAAREPS